MTVDIVEKLLIVSIMSKVDYRKKSYYLSGARTKSANISILKPQI